MEPFTPSRRISPIESGAHPEQHELERQEEGRRSLRVVCRLPGMTRSRNLRDGAGDVRDLSAQSAGSGWCHGWLVPRVAGEHPSSRRWARADRRGWQCAEEDVDGWLDEHAAGQYSRNADLSPARPTYWIMA
jgi:hypothetical protein